jgi:hypothetical protein
MSLGGLLLDTPHRPLPAQGDLLEITFVGHDDVPLECEVLRIAGDGAIEVRYLNLTAGSRMLVQRVVAAHATDPESGSSEFAPGPPSSGSDARRQTRPTGVIDEKVLQPLVDATRRLAESGAKRPGSTEGQRSGTRPSPADATDWEDEEPLRLLEEQLQRLEEQPLGSDVPKSRAPTTRESLAVAATITCSPSAGETKERSKQPVPVAEPPPPTEHRRSGSDLVKALRAATGEYQLAKENDEHWRSADKPTMGEKTERQRHFREPGPPRK